MVIYLNDTIISIGKQTFDDYQTNLYFCTWIFSIVDNDSWQTDIYNYSYNYTPNKIHIVTFNYSTEMIIIDSKNESIVYCNDILIHDTIDQMIVDNITFTWNSTTYINTTTIGIAESTLTINNGCYLVFLVNSYNTTRDSFLMFQ